MCNIFTKHFSSISRTSALTHHTVNTLTSKYLLLLFLRFIYCLPPFVGNVFNRFFSVLHCFVILRAFPKLKTKKKFVVVNFSIFFFSTQLKQCTVHTTNLNNPKNIKCFALLHSICMQ